MSISDGFGEASDVDSTILAYEGWLQAQASALVSARNDSRLQDIVQEGRIAMWRALDTYDGSRGPLTHWLTFNARRRMQAVAYGDSAPLGHTRQRGRPEVRPVTSIEAESARFEGAHDVVAFLWNMVETLGEVEVAYHHGEIMQALQTLTVKQRTYVYARFWCGIEMPAGSRNEGVRMAKDANPILRRDVLWTGNKTTIGAKARLCQALAHLRDLVTP